MSQVRVEQKSYEMPPREGFTVAHFLTVADIDRILRFYETIFRCHWPRIGPPRFRHLIGVSANSKRVEAG